MKPHTDASLGVQIQRMRGLLYVRENQNTITVLRNLWHQETFVAFFKNLNLREVFLFSSTSSVKFFFVEERLCSEWKETAEGFDRKQWRDCGCHEPRLPW